MLFIVRRVWDICISTVIIIVILFIEKVLSLFRLFVYCYMRGVGRWEVGAVGIRVCRFLLAEIGL